MPACSRPPKTAVELQRAPRARRRLEQPRQLQKSPFRCRLLQLMTRAQIVDALDEEIERLKQVRALLARDFTSNQPRKAAPKPKLRLTPAQHRRRSEGQRRRWANLRAARAAPAPQVKVTRLKPHREPHRYGSRPRKREQTALTAKIPDHPVAVKRPGGTPIAHRPFAELEKLLKAS